MKKLIAHKRGMVTGIDASIGYVKRNACTALITSEDGEELEIDDPPSWLIVGDPVYVDIYAKHKGGRA